jgi:hypothetical protein
MSNAYIYCMYVLMLLPHEQVYEQSVDVCLIALYIYIYIYIYIYMNIICYLYLFLVKFICEYFRKRCLLSDDPDLGGRGCYNMVLENYLE